MENTTNSSSAALVPLYKTRVSAWMTAAPLTVLSTAHADQAFDLMTTHRIRRLPVVDNGKLVGIVTLGDLRSMGAGTESAEVSKTTVDAVLTANVITVPSNATLVAAARLMLQHKISGIPVLSESDQTLVGIITESDIFRAFIADASQTQDA
jgi:CBS domain-containing protein